MSNTEITPKTIFITRRTKDLGWGYSTNPDPDKGPYGIIPPVGPTYTGTPGQVLAYRGNDPAFSNLGGAARLELYFAKGIPVTLSRSLMDLVDGDVDLLAATPIE